MELIISINLALIFEGLNSFPDISDAPVDIFSLKIALLFKF